MIDKETPIPAEVKGQNWGAFTFSYLWGIGNKTYLPLLALIPGFNLIWVFVCGIKGNTWAWQKGQYQAVDIDKFKATQATWNRAGIVAFIVNSVLILVSYLMFFSILMQLFSN